MIHFHGFGHFHPENKIDNAFFEALGIGTDDRWITDRVGIKCRRTVLPLEYIRTTLNKDVRAAQEASLYSNAETGRRAAMMAIERAQLTVRDIGMVISGSCSPEACVPAEATRIARALGVSVPAFDLQSACTTFGAQIHLLERMGECLPDYVLLVSPENMTRAVDFSDRATAVLFGDATSAVVVLSRVPARARVIHSCFEANPDGCDEVTLMRTGYFWQNGAAVHKFAIKKMTRHRPQFKRNRPRTERSPDLRGSPGQPPHARERVPPRGRSAGAPPLHSRRVRQSERCRGARRVLPELGPLQAGGYRRPGSSLGAGPSWASMQIEFS